MAAALQNSRPAVSPAQADQYHRDGFLILCGAFSAEEAARAPRIVDAVPALYGKRTHLFKDKLIFKPRGAAGYGVHQDYIPWLAFPVSFVTVAGAIDPAAAESGGGDRRDAHDAGFKPRLQDRYAEYSKVNIFFG